MRLVVNAVMVMAGMVNGCRQIAITVRMMCVGRLFNGILRRRHVLMGMRKSAFHGDGRERLNRKAQYQQNNKKEFAPIRHSCEV